MELFFWLFKHWQQQTFFITPYSACRVRDAVVFLSFKRFLVDRRRRLKHVTVLGCVPFDQSKSGFSDPKFDFSLHQGVNQSKIAVWTIHLCTWIVQIGILIWFQIFVAFRSQERAGWSIKTLVQATVIYIPPLFYAAKGLWYIKLKFHCNSISVRKRKRLDFLTDLKLSNVCVFRAQWGAGAVLRSLSDSDDQMGKKSKPKFLGLQTKPKELPGPKFNPQKNPVPSHKNFQEALNDITIINLQIVLNTQNNLYVNQTAQKTCENFPT